MNKIEAVSKIESVLILKGRHETHTRILSERIAQLSKRLEASTALAEDSLRDLGTLRGDIIAADLDIEVIEGVAQERVEALVSSGLLDFAAELADGCLPPAPAAETASAPVRRRRTRRAKAAEENAGEATDSASQVIEAEKVPANEVPAALSSPAPVMGAAETEAPVIESAAHETTAIDAPSEDAQKVEEPVVEAAQADETVQVEVSSEADDGAVSPEEPSQAEQDLGLTDGDVAAVTAALGEGSEETLDDHFEAREASSKDEAETKAAPAAPETPSRPIAFGGNFRNFRRASA